ncbi:MAG: polysaccharide deacetylase family protein [Candidatus Baltobacteraceae bacterium]
MKRAAAVAMLLVVAAAIGYGAYRVVYHEAHVQPAIVTPQMDAQQAISPSLAGHIKRLLNENVRYGDRAGRPKLIALTFDDGPYPVFTPLLLDALQRLNVHATFFLIGRDAEEWPDLALRIERSGNEVADHTYTHPNLDQETAAQVRGEIELGGKVLYRLVRDPAVFGLFRPPHGRYTTQTIKVAQSLGYKTVLWNDDAGDWRPASTAPALAEHLEQHATAPEIVLLHSGRLATIEMLPEVVARFRAAGYTFVTVSQLLAAVKPPELNHPAKHAV